jgi:hypothetical protein
MSTLVVIVSGQLPERHSGPQENIWAARALRGGFRGLKDMTIVNEVLGVLICYLG